MTLENLMTTVRNMKVYGKTAREIILELQVQGWHRDLIYWGMNAEKVEEQMNKNDN